MLLGKTNNGDNEQQGVLIMLYLFCPPLPHSLLRIINCTTFVGSQQLDYPVHTCYKQRQTEVHTKDKVRLLTVGCRGITLSASKEHRTTFKNNFKNTK